MRTTLLFAALILVACGAPQPPLVASDVEITRPVPGRSMSADFLVLRNNTDEDIRITRITSPQFGAVEIHETRIEDGIARMREMDALVIPAHGSVALERGGKHLMLMQPVGEPRTITLNFYSGDVLVLSVSAEFTATME